MWTIFSVPKAHKGDIRLLQKNAVTSWTRLRPRPHVILFGDEDGVAALAAETGAVHLAEIRTNRHGTPLVSDAFSKALSMSRDDLFCFINSDIILADDFIRSVIAVDGWSRDRPFLMVGRRTNLAVVADVDFDDPRWQESLRDDSAREGERASPLFIDYFAFRRGAFDELPPFAVGRAAYDNWLIWAAWRKGVKVVDASHDVTAIHQDHDYSHAGTSRQDVYGSEESMTNQRLAGGWRHLLSIAHAPYMLQGGTVKRARGADRRSVRRDLLTRRIIESTRPIRHKLGITKASADRVTQR